MVAHGFRVCHLTWSADILSRLNRTEASIVLLETTPQCQQLALSVVRAQMQASAIKGVILLAQVPDEVECVLALELGADDYVAQACSPRELLARIRALSRRRRPARPTTVDFVFGAWRYDPISRVLTGPADERQRLPTAEHSVLLALLAADGAPVARAALQDRAEIDALRYERAVDVQVSRLRRRFQGEDEVIRTVRGRGYQIVAGNIRFQ